MNSSTKNKTTAYLLCVFLGLFGGHRFYLGRMKSAIATVALIIIPVIYSIIIFASTVSNPYSSDPYATGTTIGALFMAVILILLVWCIVDLFLIPRFMNNNDKGLSNRNLSKLEKLHSLFDKGVISEEEYSAEKSKLI